MLVHPTAIVTAGHGFDPVLVIEIPADGLTDTGLESFSGMPTKFVLNFRGVNGVAAVMAGAVGDKGDLFLVGFPVGARREFVEDRANGVDDIEVRFLVPAADVIGLSGPSSGENTANGGTMVVHVQPVAHLQAIPVNRQRPTGQGVVNDQRNELLGKVKRAVVIGAIGGESGQPVGVVIGAHQVIGGGFAGRVRTVGFVGVGFAEGRRFGQQCSINLIGRHVEKTKSIPLGRAQRTVIGVGAFQKIESAQNISLDELPRSVDGPVNVGLCGEVDYRPRPMARKEVGHQLLVSNIAAAENVTWISLEGGQIRRIAGIGQFVEIDDRI